MIFQQSRPPRESVRRDLVWRLATRNKTSSQEDFDMTPSIKTAKNIAIAASLPLASGATEFITITG